MDIFAPLKFKLQRSYALTGPERQSALDRGLVDAQWYQTPIERKLLKQLMTRSDVAAIRDTALWLGLMLCFATIGIWIWGSWLAILPFVAYGILYASAADSRWHECGHGSAFKTRWLNDAVYELASFFMMRNSVVWRWSHSRHHTDTIIVGRDPEISAMRPPQLIIMCLNLLGIESVPKSLWALGRNALGKLSASEADFVPPSEHAKAFLTARIHIGIYVLTTASALWFGSWLPLVLVGLPRAYGIWLLLVMGLPQHMGLAEDVLDHRLNARTMIFGPILRFIYWNMNYHVEHHMYPLVPYHALPKLHEAVKHDCPEPETLFGAWRQIVPTVLRQLKDPAHFIQKELPPGAGLLESKGQSHESQASHSH